MQRVLSLPQLARNTYNESSDYVSKRLCFSFLLAFALIALAAGYFAGRVATLRQIELNAIICKAAKARLYRSHLDAGKSLESDVKKESIAEYYKDLNAYDSSKPGDLNFQQATKLVKHLKDAQFDSVSKVVASQVRLTFPDSKNLSMITILNGDLVEYKSPNTPSGKFSIPSGQKYQKLNRRIEGQPVYINYGTSRDYEFLDKVKIDLNGKIAIIRIGKVPLYQQITEALSLGAIGVLLFHDPKSYIYTDTIVLSPTLLGRVQHQFGDPIANSSSMNNQSIYAPNCIAVSVINIELAEYILARMRVVSMEYNPLSYYPISSGFNNSDCKLVLDFNFVNVLHTYHNVIGAIRGLEEPDRYVLMGSSRASLETNATDVLGATAAMMEIAKIFGNLKKNKIWVPRRSVVVVSWGLEGDGHFNSESWAQQHSLLMRERAVAYLSVERAVKADGRLRVNCAPMLKQTVFDTAKLIPNPKSSELKAGIHTVLDTWNKTQKKFETYEPSIDSISGEGDYQMFLHEQGIPSLDFGYDTVDGSPISGVYNNDFIDANFSLHRAVAELWAMLVWSVADTPRLPLEVTRYVEFIEKSYAIINLTYRDLIQNHTLPIEQLGGAIKEFMESALFFTHELNDVDQTDILRMRVVNDKLVQLEKVMRCNHYSAKISIRHAVLSEGPLLNGYGFGILQELLRDFNLLSDDATRSKIIQHISILSRCFQDAALLIMNVVYSLTGEKISSLSELDQKTMQMQFDRTPNLLEK
ncbi:hypothetical protein M8J76_001957 [Diaphorina citri]|nr:hypothetical protein M8J76_001957 [Diaphorina citri]